MLGVTDNLVTIKHNCIVRFNQHFSVLDVPGKPEGPLKVSDIHKEGCTLKWKPPEDDGGSPIDFYAIEKFDTETGKSVTYQLKLMVLVIQN